MKRLLSTAPLVVLALAAADTVLPAEAMAAVDRLSKEIRHPME